MSGDAHRRYRVPADHDAIRVGVHLDRTLDRIGGHRVLVVVEVSKRTRQVFETDAGTAWNPSNLPA
jgi:hypothetical protein